MCYGTWCVYSEYSATFRGAAPNVVRIRGSRAVVNYHAPLAPFAHRPPVSEKFSSRPSVEMGLECTSERLGTRQSFHSPTAFVSAKRSARVITAGWPSPFALKFPPTCLLLHDSESPLPSTDVVRSAMSSMCSVTVRHLYGESA